MSTDEPQAGLKKGGLESLSHEELVAKCKNLLIIAQKAKKAKDDALEELANQETKFKEELKSVRDKASTEGTQSIQIRKNLLDLQLEFDNCQKKMSSLEEEHKVCNAKIKKLEHQLSIEYDKRKNAELLNNNLNEDLNKLSESSGQMRLICQQVMEEKEEIEKDFKEIFQQKIEWTRYLQTAHPNESITSVKDWIAILESRKSGEDNFEEENKHLKDTNEEMKKKVEKLEKVIEDLINKKDGVSNEIVSLKNDKAKMMEELNEVRASRDTLLKKMDEVRIETTQLIENSEKLSEENGVLRVEKDKFQNSFTSLSVEHAKILKEIEVLKACNKEVNMNLGDMRVKLEEEENEKGEQLEKTIEKLQEMEEMRRELMEMENMRIKWEKMEEVKFAEEESMKKNLEEMESMKLKLGEKEGLEMKLKEMEDKKLADEKEMENLRVKLKENKSELDSLKSDYNLLQTDKNSVDNKVIELESCVKSLEEKIVELTKNLEENSEKLALSIENADIKKQLETMSKKYAELLLKINEQDRTIRSLEETVQELEDQCSGHEFECNKLKSDIKLKLNVIHEHKAQIVGLNEKCTGFENQVEKLKQELDEQTLNKNKVVDELETLKKSEKLSGKQIEELEEIEKMLKQKLVEQNGEKEEIVKNLNEECGKLKNEVERLKLEKENEMVEERETQESTKSDLVEKLSEVEMQLEQKNSEFEAFEATKSELTKKLNEVVKQLEQKNSEFEAFEAIKSDLIEKFNQIEKQLEAKNAEFEAFKSTESVLIEKLNILEKQLEMKNSLLLSKAEEEMISAETLKDLESLRNKNREVDDRLEAVEAEKNRIQGILAEKELKIKELISEIELTQLDSKSLERLNSIVSETDNALVEFSKMFLGSIKTDSELQELVIVREYIDERSKESSEIFDVLKLDAMLKNVCKLVVKEEEAKNKLMERLKVLENEKDGLEKEKGVLENERDGLEKEKSVLENEKGMLEKEKDVLKNEKEELEKEKNMLKNEKEGLEKEKNMLKNEKEGLEKENNMLKNEKKCLEKEKNVLENEKEELEKEKNMLKNEKEGLEKENNMLKNEKKCLEKEKNVFENDKKVLDNYIKDLQTDKEELEREKKVLASKIEELRSSAKESSDKISAHNVSVTESQKKLEEYEVMKSSLEECREKLRKTLEDSKKTDEVIDDLKCETGKLNSLLVVVREERDNSSSLLHKCQLEKRDLETQVEKLRLEDEENLHNLQDLNDRYLSMEEKLNFIFSENEELKGKVVELEEIHDNLLKEIENIIANNVHVLPETVANEFQNKSVKFDSLVLLKYLSEIITGLRNIIQEKDTKVEGLSGEVLSVRSELENVLKGSKELENVLKGSKELEKVLDEGLSGFKTGNIESKVKLLSQIVQDSTFFEDLFDSYARITGADVQEAKKALKLKLQDLKGNDWKYFLSNNSEEGGEKKADEFRKKEEEIAQLQDKNKELKGVAVKMKKKINDLNQLLESERQKVDAERTKLNQLSAVAKNAQMLQQECDRLTDELEECKKTIKQLQKVNDSLENEHKDLQQKYNEKENRFTEVEKEMATIRTQLESAVNKETSLVKEMEEVKTEKHVEEVIRKECEKELIITQDKLRKVQLELDQALLESQKHTVLTQEKHDYEQQLNQSHQTQNQLESKLKEASSTLAQLTGQLETERRDKDELADQLTKLTSDSQKTIEAARVQNEALLNRVSQLEADLRSVSSERQRYEEEATRLASEFGAYKVRAQSVLRQKEQGGSSAEQDARDKCAHWQQMCDRAKAQLDATVEELEQVKLKLESVVAEKDAQEKKCDNINNILLQRNKELDRRMLEHRQHKLSTDTLIQCYKTQLEEKERGHQIELESLRQQISKLSSRVNNIDADLADAAAVKVDVDNANFYQTEHTLTTSAGSLADSNTGHSPVDIAGEHGKSLPPRPPLIEREDGEGSEGNEISVFPGSLSNKTGLVPLAKLLSSSLGSDEERDVLSLEKFESLQNEMLASNARVKHLAALLSEAEKDSALMEEQNTVLKEEIRRLQRCIERQPHAHNVEYLKNVVFKFATLGSGDEKSRLVPVLDTILKLSPEEHKQLTAVAKGETEQTSGWSSYLPTWQ